MNDITDGKVTERMVCPKCGDTELCHRTTEYNQYQGVTISRFYEICTACGWEDGEDYHY